MLSLPSMKGLRASVLRMEVIISVAACSVLWYSELTLSTVLSVSQVALLAYMSCKLNEHGQTLWWIAQSVETSAEKDTHMEVRMMYENYVGHECVRQVYTWFSKYDSTVSDIFWFLDKVSSELSGFRLASLRRGAMSTISSEAFIIRLVKERIFNERAERALENWNKFRAWCLEAPPASVVKRLGQEDILRESQTTVELENDVIRDDGHQYFWSFKG